MEKPSLRMIVTSEGFLDDIEYNGTLDRDKVEKILSKQKSREILLKIKEITSEEDSTYVTVPDLKKQVEMSGPSLYNYIDDLNDCGLIKKRDAIVNNRRVRIVKNKFDVKEISEKGASEYREMLGFTMDLEAKHDFDEDHVCTFKELIEIAREGGSDIEKEEFMQFLLFLHEHGDCEIKDIHFTLNFPD